MITALLQTWRMIRAAFIGCEDDEKYEKLIDNSVPHWRALNIVWTGSGKLFRGRLSCDAYLDQFESGRTFDRLYQRRGQLFLRLICRSNEHRNKLQLIS